MKRLLAAGFCLAASTFALPAAAVPAEDLYVGWYQEDPLTNPEDPTPGSVHLSLPAGDSELVLTTRQEYEPNWLVADVPECVDAMVRSGDSQVKIW